ncbi:MAG: hypothetical protein P8J45_05595 [Phycisphaerales bacterium]|nr:hypothetical protein [Phycisphaerales bacterium]
MLSLLLFNLILCAIPVVLIWIVPRLLRVSTRRCPNCNHDVSMTARPRCLECGKDLSDGVVRAGGLRRSTTRWLALTWVIFGLLVGLFGMQMMRVVWPRFLATAGILQLEDLEVETISVVLNPAGPRIDINCIKPVDRDDGREISVYVVPTNQLITTFILPSAEWKGPAEADDDPDSMIPGYRFDMQAMIESLRSQSSGAKETTLSLILADPEDTAQLEKAIRHFTGPRMAASSTGWPRQDGTELFTGTISHRAGIDVRVLTSNWWWVPAYVAVGLIMVLYILIGLYTLRFRRTLVPWQPVEDPKGSI